MTQTGKSILSEHEEEAEPFDDVMRKLLGAKPVPKRRKEPGPIPQSLSDAASLKKSASSDDAA